MTFVVHGKGLSTLFACFSSFIERSARRLAACAVVAVACRAAADGVPNQIVDFEWTENAPFGQSIFVTGNIPQLGQSDVRLAVKLASKDRGPFQRDWSIKLAIPRGTSYQYRFIRRDDSVQQLSDPDNFTNLSNLLNGNTAAPIPALRDLSVVVPVSDGASAVAFNTAGGTVNVPLTPLPCRPDLEIATLANQPNGKGISAAIVTTSINVPIHTVFRRGSQLFDFEPGSGGTTAGTIETRVLATNTVPATRIVNGVSGRGYRVYLPRGYAVNTWRRYPVAYFQDGQNVFGPGNPLGTWSAELVADSLIQQGRIRELIMVAVDNSPQRNAEYVPEFSEPGLNNDDYNQFLIQELKPFIDATYRTLTGPADTANIGSSFGGIAAAVLGLDHSDVFGRIGCMSPPFWAGATDDRLKDGLLPPSVRFYMDCGDTNDNGELSYSVRDSLVRDGRVWEQDFFFRVGFGQTHEEAAWSARLPHVLLALFPIVDEPNAAELLVPLGGDLNIDGGVTLLDSPPLRDLLLGIRPPTGCPEQVRADLNKDGRIDGDDVVLFVNRLISQSQ